MGWDDVRERPPPHTCAKPRYDEAQRVNAGVGSRWSCDDCGLTWRIRAFSTKPSDPTDVAVDWVRADLPTPRSS